MFSVVVSAAAWGLAVWLALAIVPAAMAGRIEDRADGTTVIHVTLFALPNPDATDVSGRANLEILALFKRRFPEIFAGKYRQRYEANPEVYGRHDWSRVEIQLHAATGLSLPGVETGDMLAIAGGMAPDVFYINFRRMDNFMRNGFLYPLDEYYSTLAKEDVEARIHPKLWSVIRRKGPDKQLRIWTLPYGGFLGKLLMYRKDLFDKNGLAYPTVEWTWDDLLVAARKITRPEKGEYGFLSFLNGYYFQNFLWSAGGDVMRYDEPADEWSCVYDTPQAVTALDFFLRLNTEKWTDAHGQPHRGYTVLDQSDTDTKWDRGQIGMRYGYIDDQMFATIDPNLVGICPVPLGPTGMRGSEINSKMYGMFAGIQDAAVRDAAWEYMVFADSPEALTLLTRRMVEGGLAKYLNPKHLDRFGFPEMKRFTPPGYAEVYKITFDSGFPEPCGKNSNFAYQMMSEPIQAAADLAFADRLPDAGEERRMVLAGLLRDSCIRANEVMIGRISPAKRLVRRLTASLVLIAVVIGFSLVFRRIVRIFTPPAVTGAAAQPAWQFRKYWFAYLLLIPAVFSIAVWGYLPVIQGASMAFFDYKLLGKSVFVGIDNFGDVLFSALWWNALWNSMRYCFFVILLTFAPPVLLAVVLQEIPRGRLFFRIVYYLPAMITGIVTILLWKQLFDPSRYGMLNQVVLRIPAVGFLVLGGLLLVLALVVASRLSLYEMRVAAWMVRLGGAGAMAAVSWPAVALLYPQAGEGLVAVVTHLPVRLLSTMTEPVRWLHAPETAMLSCILPMVWAGVGPGSLIYLAALKGIPDDYYEAAEIDGASFVDKLLFVVFPHLKVLLTINFVGSFIGAWCSGAGNILVMTGGQSNTEVAAAHLVHRVHVSQVRAGHRDGLDAGPDADRVHGLPAPDAFQYRVQIGSRKVTPCPLFFP